MATTIYCVKLKKQAEALAVPPYPGELGKRIHAQISREAWQEWQKRQTMIINEYRLSLSDPQARKQLEQEMVNFLFGEAETSQEK